MPQFAMNMNTLQKVNLNLLVVFVVLMRERSATRAAEKLSRTQPAVSASLRSLRATFRDKLFTRKSQGMAPTLVATALYEDLLPSLDMIEATLNKRMSAGKDSPTPKQRGRFRR
ncbi:MAG TPA: LysR family transcriptional regulator [Steroidobacteraceae bacterium]